MFMKLRFKSIFILLAVFIVFGCQPASRNLSESSKPISKDTITIATLNCEFLFDGKEPEGRADFPWKDNPTLAEQHMEKISSVIRKINADIINLVEVENLDVLKHINKTYLKDMGYKEYLINGKDTFTLQNVGLLSRLNIESIQRTDNRVLVEGKSKGVSKNYYARLHLDGLKLTIIGLHFESGPTNRLRKSTREAQAEVIRQLAVSEFKGGRSIIVMGDFNDYDEGEFLDHVDSKPITDVLKRIRIMDPSDPNDDLYNIAGKIPKQDRYTCWWDKNDNGKVDLPKEVTSIDHILISKYLTNKIESATILNHEYNPAEVTDHFPVILKLRVNQ